MNVYVKLTIDESTAKYFLQMLNDGLDGNFKLPPDGQIFNVDLDAILSGTGIPDEKTREFAVTLLQQQAIVIKQALKYFGK